MTSSVSNVLNSLTLAKSQGTQGIQNADGEFDLLLHGTAVSTAGQAPVDILPRENTGGDMQRSYDKAKTEAAYKELAKVKQPGKGVEITDRIKEDLESLKEQAAETIAEQLDVSVEDVLKAMELLGLSMENLLMGNGLADLAKELTGAVDMTELLFYDDFRNLMQEMDVLMQNFMQENGISDQELNDLLSTFMQENEESVMMTETSVEEVSTETELSDRVQPDAEQPVKTGGNDSQGALTGVPREPEQQELSENASKDQSMSEQEPGQNQFTTGRRTEMDREPAGHQQVTYQEVQTTVRSVGEQIVETVQRTYVDADDIMRQVTEFTRVTVAQAQSSIEMQLNPAHLGKIYLQVVSKEGVITAQLAAQNEAVKQALESQAAAFKENMNQQGLKVEAVEVTIASHEFEQNLEGQREQNRQEQAEEQGRRSRRFLNVDQLDSIADTLTEEETLAAKIMLEHGNSMDVTA